MSDMFANYSYLIRKVANGYLIEYFASSDRQGECYVAKTPHDVGNIIRDIETAGALTSGAPAMSDLMGPPA
jgi:hypothetical protein